MPDTMNNFARLIAGVLVLGAVALQAQQAAPAGRPELYRFVMIQAAPRVQVVNGEKPCWLDGQR